MGLGIDLSIHRKLSLLTGFCYPLPENYYSRSACFRFFWSLYVYVPQCFMILEIMSQAVQISLSYRNFEALTTCILAVGYLIHFLLKLTVFRRNKVVFDRLFEEISVNSRDLMQNPLGDDTFLKFFNRPYKRAITIDIIKGIVQMTCNVGLNVLFCVLSWIGKTPEITTAYTWTPFDSTTNPGFTLTCLFEIVAYGSVTVRTTAFDLIFLTMIIIPMAQMNFLKHLLGIILRDSPVDDVNQIDKTDIMDSGTEVSEELVSRQMEWWVKMHQRVLGTVEEFETLASPYLAANFIASIVNVFMSGYVAISESKWDASQSILINAIIISDVFQLYYVSLAGDWLRESSQNVADYGFTALIFKLKREFRQNYLFILSRTRQLIRLRFGGIYPLSSPTFLALIQVTLTYFVTLLQLRSSQSRSE